VEAARLRQRVEEGVEGEVGEGLRAGPHLPPVGWVVGWVFGRLVGVWVEGLKGFTWLLRGFGGLGVGR